MLPVVAIFPTILTVLWTSANICALFYYVLVEQVLKFSLSWQTGIFLLLSRSLIKGSATELIQLRETAIADRSVRAVAKR